MSYAEQVWRMEGAAAAATPHDRLAAALERAPRKQERDWVQAGYDEYLAAHPRGAQA